MADPIRPSLPQLTPRPQGGPSEAARAAQRAFFAQAMNGVQAQAAAEPAAPAIAAPARQAIHVDRINIPAEPPERPTRPGVHLDIKV